MRCHPYTTCCYGSCCDWNNCETCVDGECKLCDGRPELTCCNGGCCGTGQGGCLSCVDGLGCVKCGGDPYKHCCEGTCYDTRTQNCCPRRDGHLYICGINEACCNGHCCPPGQCCDNDVCVDKCNPNGASCNWTAPPVSSSCPGCTIDDPSCCSIDEGLLCHWEILSQHTTSAKCADCAPGCGLIRDDNCVVLKPHVCGNSWLPFIGVYCNCKNPEGLVDYTYLGDHYICP